VPTRERLAVAVQVDSLLDIEVATGGDVNAESLGAHFLRKVAAPLC